MISQHYQDYTKIVISFRAVTFKLNSHPQGCSGFNESSKIDISAPEPPVSLVLDGVDADTFFQRLQRLLVFAPIINAAPILTYDLAFCGAL